MKIFRGATHKSHIQFSGCLHISDQSPWDEVGIFWNNTLHVAS